MLLAWTLLGLVVGAALNLLIVRLPKRKFPFELPVTCRYCRKPLSFLELLPLVSYVWGRGRCRRCGQRLEFRYLLVEVTTGGLFAALFARFGLSWPLIIYSFYASVFVIVFMIDWQHRRILNVVTYPSIAVALALMFITPGLGAGQALLGGLFYGGLFFALYVIGTMLYRQSEALGLGDVKLALFIGLITGLQGALAAALIGTLLGAVFGLALMVFKRASARAGMPYGPALSMGALAAILWSPWIR